MCKYNYRGVIKIRGDVSYFEWDELVTEIWKCFVVAGLKSHM